MKVNNHLNGNTGAVLYAEGSVNHSEYPAIFWNIFNANHMAVAVAGAAGEILFCNKAFQTRVIEQGGINIQNYADTAEVFITKDAINIRLMKIKLQPTSEFTPCIWLGFVEADPKRASQLSVVEHLQRSMVATTAGIVFRTSVSDALLYFNRAFIRFFNIKYTGVREGKFEVAGLFEDAEYYHLIKARVLKEGSVVGETIYFKSLSGRRLIGLVNCETSCDDFNQKTLCWSITDITDRKEFEEKLEEKNDQLAKVNSQMEKILYSASHDLRSPLTSILGLVNLMRMEGVDKNILEYSLKIEASAQRLDKIIRDIMSFSKTSYQAINEEPIDFETLVWSTIRTYHDDPNYGQLSFEVNIKGTDPFYSDRERIGIILDSLVRNCIHFMDSNKVRPFVRINAILNEHEVCIEVIDNGVGIAKENLDQIFNMFYKGSLLSRGAGLGLSIVKEGIDQLHGTIKVESELGFGSIFTLCLPNLVS